MPTYEYECDACGHRMDAFQSITESPLRKCPACGRLKLRRLIGAGAAVLFKGSGFYVTDNRRNSGGSPRKGKSASDTPDKSKTESAEPASPKKEPEKSKSEA